MLFGRAARTFRSRSSIIHSGSKSRRYALAQMKSRNDILGGGASTHQRHRERQRDISTKKERMNVTQSGAERRRREKIKEKVEAEEEV